ncbi:hypothetical protein AB870_21105 [Pandoraea faecigallinarum]|uniref:Uncharacterized protein n=1 Tax=Pandoraea faecigallinarum TaxID=656179 RepID=A0A0H3WZR5_9BURK|nr:hypothetical protein [Pandoraea faecigallinarum]AKM32071.1 hypothetical protein AB870_21105 [Pandoraea faecigallinarum]
MKEVLEKPLENPQFYHSRMSCVMVFLHCNNASRLGFTGVANFPPANLSPPSLTSLTALAWRSKDLELSV